MPRCQDDKKRVSGKSRWAIRAVRGIRARRAAIASTAGGASRGRANSRLRGLASLAMALRSIRAAWSGVGTTPHKRVKYGVAGLGEALDEVFRQLSFKAGAVADFVQGMALALLGGPEFADDCRGYHLASRGRIALSGLRQVLTADESRSQAE